MSIFSKIKKSILHQSDMYRFYEAEYQKNNNIDKKLINNNKKIEKLQKDFKKYKKENDRIINAYNSLFNSLFIYNEITPKRLVKLSRELTMELLDFIDHVCKKYNLEWWMFAGTLLGAIRHEGYIPWDDDVDINMMREDYEKFYKVFPIELENHGLSEYITINTSTITATGIYLPFIKITIYLNHDNFAFIDVFPTDYVYDEIEDYKTVHKNEHHKLTKKLQSGENRETSLNEAFEKLHVSKEKTDMLMIGVEDPISCMITNNETIFPLTKLKFENREYPCPNNYIEYIKKIYGEDYMKVPKTAYSHGYYEYLSGHENVYSRFEDTISKLHEINENF